MEFQAASPRDFHNGTHFGRLLEGKPSSPIATFQRRSPRDIRPTKHTQMSDPQFVQNRDVVQIRMLFSGRNAPLFFFLNFKYDLLSVEARPYDGLYIHVRYSSGPYASSAPTSPAALCIHHGAHPE
jgi:hypothetical protein